MEAFARGEHLYNSTLVDDKLNASNEATLGRSNLELVRGARIRRDVCLDRARDSRYGPHLMGGEKVTRSEWLHIAAPLVAVMGCLMASIAYGLAARKAWSRHLVMAIFVLIIVYPSTRRTECASAHDYVACHS